MKQLLTPRDLALAIGVSESSLRRWVDAGLIPSVKTAGGHRRIALADAVQYIRSTNAVVVRPEVLGLAELAATPAAAGTAGDDERIYEALHAGDSTRFLSMLMMMYLSGRSVAGICDGPLRKSMHRLGELWRHEAKGILLEHRGVDLCVRAICQLRQLLPAPPADAPLALGGGVETDPYVIPAMMAAATLEDAGFCAVNFGANTPVHLLGDAAEDHDARVVWVSVSSTAEPARLLPRIEELARRLAGRGTHLVLGGRAVRDHVAKDHPNLHVLHSMAELAAFAGGLRAGKAK